MIDPAPHDNPGDTGDGAIVCERPAVFDWAQFADIERAVGASNAHLLLTLLASEALARPAVIAKLAAADSSLALLAEAHAMRGAAGSVGALRLAAAASMLEAAIAAGTPTAASVEEIASAAAATLDAIAARL